MLISRRRLLVGGAATGIFVAKAPAILAFPLRGSVAGGGGDAMTALLASMNPNTWASVPSSTLTPHAYANDTGAPDYNASVAAANTGTAGPVAANTGPFQGAAYDTVRNRLIVGVAGAHLSGFDNSIYAFSLSSLTWQRIRTPDNAGASAPWGIQTGHPAIPNGNPVGQHTYSTIRFIENYPDANGCLFINGASADYTGGCSFSDPTCSNAFYWRFNAEAPITSAGSPGINWQPPSGINSGPNAGSSGWFQAQTGPNSDAGYVIQVPGQSKLIEFTVSAALAPTPAMLYDFPSNTWNNLSSSYWAAGNNVCIQPRGTMAEAWSTGGFPTTDAPYTGLRKYSLVDGSKTEITPTGSDLYIISSCFDSGSGDGNPPWMTYHQPSDRFVCWGPVPARNLTGYSVPGAGNIFDIINPNTGVITQVQVNGAGTITMPNNATYPSVGGSAGHGQKLVYDAIHNCFAMITVYNEPIYVYKPYVGFPA